MQIEHLVSYLDDPYQAVSWLGKLGLEDLARAHSNLVALADHGIPLDLMTVICR